MRNKDLVVNSCLSWLVDHYGVSVHYAHSPYVVYEDDDDYGYFDPEDNEIILCKKAFESRESLLRTLIHEYTHYLQDPDYVFTHEANEEALKNEQDWILYEGK